MHQAKWLSSQQDQAALDKAVTTKDIEDLYWTIINENVSDEESILRKAYVVAASHRPASAAVAARNGTADMFHTFLTVGACNSAALTLLEPGFSYTVSHGSARGYRASVVIPGTDREVFAEGATFALALVAAYLAALIAI